MTKEQFDKVIARAKECPCILVGDNMLLFNVNQEGNYFTQDADFVYCFRPNPSTAGSIISQTQYPYEVVTFAYDQIQYIKVYPNREVITQFIDGMDIVNEKEGIETIEKLKHVILSSTLLKTSDPKGNSEYRHEAMGKFPGLTVTVGTELDPYSKNAMDAENNGLSVD